MSHEKAEHALKQAQRAVRNGNLVQAERWTKVSERLVDAAARLAQAPQPINDEENEEARRAELRRRLALFSEADSDIQMWERERDLYEAALAAAIANNTEPPAPLRPHPAGREANREAYMKDFLLGERWGSLIGPGS
ncbi:MAG: hypothetical protein K2X34_07520 [Hyphomonadaceae bacterium]|nr:hypothetical protein [Hyphomonadaceae bacterium]